MSELDKINLLRSFIRHRAYVGDALIRIGEVLSQRARVHDLSKLLNDEFETFARINHVAREQKFGSEEYKASMRVEAANIDVHFARNRHHPEFFSDITTGQEYADRSMTFLDIIEMACDWYGARKGYDDPRDWESSLSLNLQSKGHFLNEHQLWLAKEVARFLGEEPTP